MKNLIVVILLLLAFVSFGSCDRRGRELDRTFDRADALMNDHPDSALSILNSLDTTGLSRARIARYALLLTKAQHKTHNFPENDSLIKVSVDYYCGHGDENEIAALFFYGNILYAIDSINKAMPILEMAYDQASEKKNWYYMGMSARTLSDIYNKTFLYPSQIKYALLAKEAFEKYEIINNIEDKRFSRWIDVSISSYLVDTDQYKRCIDFCDSLESSPIWK